MRIVLVVFAAAVATAPVRAEDPRIALMQLPVTGMMTVDPAEYRRAATVAERGAAPIDVALAVTGPLEGLTQHVIQNNDASEVPSASRVIVLRDGLPDDSIRGERWEIALVRSAAGPWTIVEVKRAWRCRRGGEQNRFAASPCP